MKKKIEIFIRELSALTDRTGLWIHRTYLNECGGWIEYDYEEQKYKFFKET